MENSEDLRPVFDRKAKESGKSTSKKYKNDMWDFNVEIDMVPSYIRASLVSKILTIGQTIIMFGNDPRETSKGNVWW